MTFLPKQNKTYEKYCYTDAGAQYAVYGFCPASPFGGPQVVSPEVHEDGSVTFRLDCPKAITVQLTGDFLSQVMVDSPLGQIETPRAVAMRQDEQGIWTYTTSSLEPELYSYNTEM